MKLTTFSVAGDRRLGLVDGDRVTTLTDRIPGLPKDMIGLIAAWEDLSREVAALKPTGDYKLSDVKLLAPVPRPGKVLGIGLNYADHIAEAGMKRPEHQLWFAKAVTAVNGPFDPILRPVVSTALDYEAELVFVVGKRCRHMPAERAHEAIFGYCAGNDVSVRDWQMRTGQFTLGKSFDTHAPFGPFIVTADEIDPGKPMHMTVKVNGEVTQDDNTASMIFSFADLIAYITTFMTIKPADIIVTGTPVKLGPRSDPPRWLKAGDTVEISSPELGTLRNTVVDEE